LVPACTDRDAPSSAPVAADDPAFAELGPLAAAPALAITLPKFREEVGGRLFPPNVQGARIPGGILVTVNGDEINKGSMLAAVNFDGSVRWVRCFADAPSVHASGASGTATETLIETSFVDTQPRIIDLIDGHDKGSLQERTLANDNTAVIVLMGTPAADGADNLVFARTGAPIAATDRIAVVDASFKVVATLPVPGVAVGHTWAEGLLRRAPTGDLTIVDYSNAQQARRGVAVYHQGRWLDERAAGHALWAATFPPVIEFDYTKVGAPLHSTDVDGKVLWKRDDLLAFVTENLNLGTSNGTTIAMVCRTLGAPTGCTDPALVGVDSATGQDRWRLEGVYSISFVANGYAAVQRESVGAVTPPWQLIDFASGRPPAPDQQWSDNTAFAVEDRGRAPGSSTDYSKPDGGMVITVRDNVLSVWLPKAHGTPTAPVTIP
jgi:hypothetical protein